VALGQTNESMCHNGMLQIINRGDAPMGPGPILVYREAPEPISPPIFLGTFEVLKPIPVGDSLEARIPFALSFLPYPAAVGIQSNAHGPRT